MFTNNIVHTTSYQTANALPCFVWGGAIFYYYVGVAGKARKVKKVYVGVGGKARLVWQSYIPVTGISFTSVANYKDSTYNADGVAKITILFTPSNATNKTVAWSIAKNGEFLDSMSILKTTSDSCIICKDIWYGARCILLAKAADGKQKYIFCYVDGIGSHLGVDGWRIYEVPNADEFPE